MQGKLRLNSKLRIDNLKVNLTFVVLAWTEGSSLLFYSTCVEKREFTFPKFCNFYIMRHAICNSHKNIKFQKMRYSPLELLLCLQQISLQGICSISILSSLWRLKNFFEDHADLFLNNVCLQRIKTNAFHFRYDSQGHRWNGCHWFLAPVKF